MTSTAARHANRVNLLNVPETRAACPFEYRQDRDGRIVLEGYAATFDPYDVYGGPDKGGWTEQLQRTAFDVTLASKPDVMLLVNQEGMALARTTTDTLFLARDRAGLKIRALLDPADPDVQRLIPKLKPQANGRSNMDEMSFGFRVKDQLWDQSYTQRTITEVSLHHGDVSVVNYGANSATQVAIGDALEAAAALSEGQLVELRRLDASLADALDAVAHTYRADKPKKYAEVENFGDPGYLDAQGNPAKGGNGVKRYPLNTAARVRNAAARLAQNKGRYTAEQYQAILGRIKSAGKRLGVDISDDDKKSEPPIPYSAPAPAVVRGDYLPLGPADPTEVPYTKNDDEDDEEDVEGCDEEAFGCPTNDTISVGAISAALRMVREAADPAGLRSITARLAELDKIRVSLPPTLAP